MNAPTAPAVTFTAYTADDVQRAAEAICYYTHLNACPAWGQARLLFNHSGAAVRALETIGPILARQPMAETPDHLPEDWSR